MVYRGFLPKSKAAGACIWQLTSLVTRSRKRGALPTILQYVFMAWCLFKHRDNITFTLPRQLQFFFPREVLLVEMAGL